MSRIPSHVIHANRAAQFARENEDPYEKFLRDVQTYLRKELIRSIRDCSRPREEDLRPAIAIVTSAVLRYSDSKSICPF